MYSTYIQNREVVFGRGILNLGGINQAAFASGLTSKDVLYLDILSEDESEHPPRLT